MRTVRGPLTMVKVMLNRLVSTLLGGKVHTMGNTLAIGLRPGLVDAGVLLEYDTETVDLLLEVGREA